MNKIVVGLLLGLILGAIDGATAWLYPETHSMIASIMVGSSVKGMVVGLLSGWFARKVQSTTLGSWSAPLWDCYSPIWWRLLIR